LAQVRAGGTYLTAAMIAALIGVALAAHPDLTPAGPISAKLSQSYTDLDKVQDSILAAEKVEEARIDKLPQSPNDPWGQIPSSFLQGDDIDKMETTSTIDFGDLDKLQSSLAGLHKKMSGELQNLKTETSKDEEFAKKQAEEAAVAESLVKHVQAPSSFLEEESDKPSLFATVHNLEHVHKMLAPLKAKLLKEMHNEQPNKKAHTKFALHQLFALDALTAKSVQLMDALEKAEASENQKASIKAILRLREGMKIIKSSVKKHLEALKSDNLFDTGHAAHQLMEKLNIALSPLKRKLSEELNDPNTDAKTIQYDSAQLSMLEGLAHKAGLAMEAAHLAKSNQHTAAQRRAASARFHASMMEVHQALVKAQETSKHFALREAKAHQAVSVAADGSIHN